MCLCEFEKEKLLEVIKRLAVVLIWLVGGGLSPAVFEDCCDGHRQTGVRDDNDIIPVVAIPVVTCIVHKLINWIPLKD